MLQAIILAAALLGRLPASASAAAADSEGAPILADPRLAAPDEFARFADTSRARPAAAPSPVLADIPALGSRPVPSLSTRPARPFGASRARVPSPRPWPSIAAPESGRPSAGGEALRIGLQAVGVALLATGLGLWRSRPRDDSDEILGSGTGQAPVLGEPPKETPRDPAPRPRYPGWRPPAPAVADLPAAPALPWWAISAAEQAAIERWDRSVEKEFGVLPSMEAWLDAHASDLNGVDVPLLKSKLSRDA